jgi:hypothetical protein
MQKADALAKKALILLDETGLLRAMCTIYCAFILNVLLVGKQHVPRGTYPMTSGLNGGKGLNGVNGQS